MIIALEKANLKLNETIIIYCIYNVSKNRTIGGGIFVMHVFHGRNVTATVGQTVK